MVRAFCLLAGLPGALAAQTRHELRPAREAAFLGAGLGLGAAGFLLAQRDQGPVPLDRWAVPGLDRVATEHWSPAARRASDVLFGAAAGAALIGAYRNQQGEQPLLPVAIIAESALLSAGLTGAVKELVQRPRPYLYNAAVPASEHDGARDAVSFWSGHAANTAAISFACASLVQRSDASKGWKTVAWVAAAAAPAAMGYLRVRAGQHFPTDVLTGYAVGAGVGVGTAYFHRPGKRPLER
jgi:membrane-associated phospholipid phosphatase